MEPVDKSILVIGGGITGLTAALEAAKAGSQVYLVEKEPQLGGWANKFHKVFNGKPPYTRTRGFTCAGKDFSGKSKRQDKGLYRPSGLTASPARRECST